MASPRLQLAPGVNFQSLGDGEDGVVLSMGSGYLFRCNHTAVAILEQLHDQPTLVELEKRLASHFGLSEEQAHRDLSAFVADLMREALIVPVAA